MITLLCVLAVIAVILFVVEQKWGLAHIWDLMCQGMTSIFPAQRTSVEDYMPKPAPPLWQSKTTTVKTEAIPLVDRLRARYAFADVKTSDSLNIISWKNYAGRRMQAPLDTRSGTAWQQACTLIEDSLHDVKPAPVRVKKTKRC